MFNILFELLHGLNQCLSPLMSPGHGSATTLWGGASSPCAGPGQNRAKKCKEMQRGQRYKVY